MILPVVSVSPSVFHNTFIRLIRLHRAWELTPSRPGPAEMVRHPEGMDPIGRRFQPTHIIALDAVVRTDR